MISGSAIKDLAPFERKAALTMPELFKEFDKFDFGTFCESPKVLLSKGRIQDAIDVLRKIAKFNGAPEPTLTRRFRVNWPCDMI
ncbi:hypothetical protein N7508_006021 [Penicillium antarcticum]|uniref:uncharacterized protein n=1 Tax=Penicillium antarcticum TaxID=416450 RepID=UPI00238C8146|nr:uncharacterized protein N7508_006021 [Penicillium antarcticum]KAJ5307006.1 hypothetical protein N7508_006021 [Penicillium antarcticum]